MRKQRALVAGLLVMSLGGAAWGSPLLTLQIEGSTNATGPFNSYVYVPEGPGQTIYYEVNAIFNDGASNINTANVPNRTSDSIDSLPSFQLTSTNASMSWGSLAMQNGFGTGTGAGVAQPIGGNTAVIRAVNSPGVYLNADSPLTIATGQLTMGTSSYPFAQLTAAYFSTSGLTRVAGALTTITGTTESSADPIIAYSPLQLSDWEYQYIPEPASLAVFSVAAVGLLRRCRQSV